MNTLNVNGPLRKFLVDGRANVNAEMIPHCAKGLISLPWEKEHVGSGGLPALHSSFPAL
jgi:hypothetical protein